MTHPESVRADTDEWHVEVAGGRVFLMAPSGGDVPAPAGSASSS